MAVLLRLVAGTSIRTDDPACSPQDCDSTLQIVM
jgi:hypothetical protein